MRATWQTSPRWRRPRTCRWSCRSRRRPCMWRISPGWSASPCPPPMSCVRITSSASSAGHRNLVWTCRPAPPSAPRKPRRWQGAISSPSPSIPAPDAACGSSPPASHRPVSRWRRCCRPASRATSSAPAPSRATAAWWAMRYIAARSSPAPSPSPSSGSSTPPRRPGSRLSSPARAGRGSSASTSSSTRPAGPGPSNATRAPPPGCISSRPGISRRRCCRGARHASARRGNCSSSTPA